MNEEIAARTKWFCEARFGMFIHWGLYAIPARGEWMMSAESMSAEKYKSLYFDQFTAAKFDAASWVEDAKRAGMKYIVLTAKHHDGFCLYDSQCTDYKVTNTPCGRDIVREFLDAGRAAGLKVGLYFSLLDWSHPDFPKYEDKFHPLRGNTLVKDEQINFAHYIDYMHSQVKELVQNYGALDIMWFDFSYDDMCGAKWKAEELVTMVRHYQPDIVIDNRMEGSGSSFGSIVTENPSKFSGDFVSPEQSIPVTPPCDNAGRVLPWELCSTMNNSWGYVASDHLYKPAAMLVRNLVECVSKSGNMLLNVGPDAKGCFPKEAASLLRQVGDWMEENSESIYGCGMANLPKPDWGFYTQKEDVIFAHLTQVPLGPIPLVGITPELIEQVTLLRDGSEMKNARLALGARENLDTYFVSLGENPNFTYPLPDDRDTVLKIQLRG